MDLTREVSIVIPLRVDNPERAENLRFILSLLLQQTEVSVDILEADTEQRFYLSETCERVRYRFVKDDDPVFYRTRYLNILLRSAKYPIAGIWDTSLRILSLIASFRKIKRPSYGKHITQPEQILPTASLN